MIITELYLKNFGKFHETRIALNQGVHVLYGENEFGKTTLYAFIKAMLFGLERGRGKAAAKDEFSRYEPWENPNYYAGQMDFLAGGRRFRLVRNFDRYQKSASLHCVDDGEELSVEKGDLEMLLGGVTATTFESTIAIGQMGRRPGEELADELKNYAANYYTTGSANIDLAKALSVLQIRRKEAQKAADKRKEEQLKKRELLEQEMGFVRTELGRLQEELRSCEESGKQCGMEKGQTREERNDRESARDIAGKKDRGDQGERGDREINWHRLLGILCGFLLLGLIGWNLLSGVVAIVYVVTVVVAIFALRFAHLVKKRDRSFSGSSGSSKVPEQLEKQQGWQLFRIQKEQRDKQIRLENLQEQFTELTEVGADVIELQKKTIAIEFAIQRLQEVGTQLLTGSGQTLNQKASQILGEITRGEYTRLWVREDLSLEVTKNDRRVLVERLSGGTIEQIYFALRMAAAEILYEEPLPIILDEAFAFYDDKRLQSVLKWLQEQNRQVIIFTCREISHAATNMRVREFRKSIHS